MRRTRTLALTLIALTAAAAALLPVPRVDASSHFIPNSTFDANVSGWTVFTGITFTWNGAEDAGGSPVSGGAEMHVAPIAGFATGVARCVEIAPGISFATTGDVRVPTAGQNPGTLVYLSRIYFDLPDCTSGLSTPFSSSAFAGINDAWQPLTHTEAAPATADSVWVYLVIVNGSQAADGYAFWDNVRLSAPGDADADGCEDGRELAEDEIFGGLRDPNNYWDFYDVTADKAIDLNDALTILKLFGLQPGHVDYDPLLDRYAPDPDQPWRTAEAIGIHLGIDLEDALVNLQSFGHNCT